MSSLEGSVNEIVLVDRLVELANERFTGAIRFERESVIKIIYFKEGTILSASTNDRGDSIDEILLTAGKLTREHVRQALAKRKESETLGDALLTLGFITRKELAWARRIQLVGIIRSISAWPDGTFTIVHDYLPKREEGTAFNAAQIIVELLVTEEERTAVEQALDHGEMILRRTGRFDTDYLQLDLNADADEIIQQVDGSRTALEIAANTAIDAFAVFKLLNALRVLRLLEPAEAQVSHEVFGAATAIPSFDASPTVIQPQASFGFEERAVPTFPKTAELTVDPDLFREPLPFESLPGIDDDAMPEPIFPTPAASVRPLSMPTAKRRRRTPVVVAAVLVVLVGAGGFAGWKFLLNREAGDGENITASTPIRAAAATPAPALDAGPSPAEPPAGTPLTDAHTAAGTIPASSDPLPEPAASQQETRPNVQKIAEPAPKKQERDAAASPVDATRARYDAMAAEYARSRRGGGFTIQFELVCQTESVTRALSKGVADVWFMPMSYKGRDCFRMFYGEFSSRGEAEAALPNLPLAIRSTSKPAVVSLP